MPSYLSTLSFKSGENVRILEEKELQTLPADSPYPEKKFIKFNWLRPRLHKHLRKLKINV